MQAKEASGIQSHHDLLVWQKAMDLVDRVYDVTDGFPSKEEYRLVSQLVRAAVSVPANIAEGCSRATSRDFPHFLVVARGSLAELDTEIEIARRRHYLSDEDAVTILGMLNEINRMTTSLRSKVISRNHKH